MYRGRRLRKNSVIRDMMKETRLSAKELVYPLFVTEQPDVKQEIPAMPGVYHYSLDHLHEILDEMVETGVLSCILFGIPLHKDACGSSAYAQDGIIQKAIAYIKQEYPMLYVIADVCMCEYTDHGHCGILCEDGHVDNDVTLTYLNKIALSYAAAGVDMVAPSDMMDGHIASIRECLDAHGYQEVAIMGYSAKYASSYYGPFREAAHSAPSFGDRRSYQMDYANQEEAMREIAADIEEGADVIMVKPALAYLDIVKMAKHQFATPLCVYNVSGEYSMLKLAVAQGLVKEEVIYETMLAFKRAGADIIITYFALDIAKQLRKGEC
ncbi:porphobilinogen synthase [Longicatena caecimuris]|uniref:Delta-aminolevulinic acid dehydratase n=1 Tax=Longicatena caecimuris TaxID=1796635 RepID=A0A4R3TAS3_9FIRM|nr:porphobilinogen synthase [Longicatena caecimuris]MCR1871291.1 porphobilinogen synthase [Longicatena caecimuris]MCU0102979.1 porphobilinogen synthase [Longicatena caecimuris]TCU58289.1 porphobilinogen synthase [Longicatena caecimuris]